MKIVLGFAATALALAMGGCGSSSEGDGFGPDPDLAGIQGRFDRPDGTFNASNASRVFESGTNGSSSASELNFGSGGSSGGSSTETKSVGLHVLDAASGKASPFHCSALQSGQQSGSCACPSGGSIDYLMSGSGQGSSRSALMKFRMNACSSGDTTVDGTEYIDVRTDATDPKKPSFSMLLVIDATVMRAGQSKRIDLQARFASTGYEIAVKVDDGWVVVSAKSSENGKAGSWSVRDRNGSWTCSMSDGHGSCSSDKGETKTF
jgi:hypothetical protein